jgi:hypothetical protein
MTAATTMNATSLRVVVKFTGVRHAMTALAALPAIAARLWECIIIRPWTIGRITIISAEGSHKYAPTFPSAHQPQGFLVWMMYSAISGAPMQVVVGIWSPDAGHCRLLDYQQAVLWMTTRIASVYFHWLIHAICFHVSNPADIVLYGHLTAATM